MIVHTLYGSGYEVDLKSRQARRPQRLGLMPGKACAFIHDETISDCRVDDVEEVKAGQEFWMLRAAEELLADVRMKVDTVAMKHWSKKATVTTPVAVLAGTSEELIEASKEVFGVPV